MGLLFEFIDHEGTLDRKVRKGASDAGRRRWAGQIQDTVQRLHAMDVVWGDVKPDNVLIDLKGDALVVDFGGGFAPQWVDKELEGTKEGDLQGLRKIMRFLGF